MLKWALFYICTNVYVLSKYQEVLLLKVERSTLQRRPCVLRTATIYTYQVWTALTENPWLSAVNDP